HGQCCNAADRRRQPSDRPLKPFVQNRHFVRPKVAVPFALHVYDEVAALTLPTWHQPGPVSPPRASANAPFGHGDVGSTSRANPRVPSPWHETHPPARVLRQPLESTSVTSSRRARIFWKVSGRSSRLVD